METVSCIDVTLQGTGSDAMWSDRGLASAKTHCSSHVKSTKDELFTKINLDYFLSILPFPAKSDRYVFGVHECLNR